MTHAIARLLVDAVERHAERLAVVDGAVRHTHAAWARRVQRLAGHFRARGLRPGDRVAILAWNGHVYLETYFAAAWAGLVLCPLNVRLAAPELRFLLEDAGVRLVLADPAFRDRLREALPPEGASVPVLWIGSGYEAALASADPQAEPAPVRSDDVAHLYYTSGTTGRPKGVMLTHRNVCVHAKAAVQELDIRATEVWGHVAPLFHLADAWATFAVTQAGGRHVCVPRFEARAVLEAIERERITLTNLVPTMLNLLVHHPDVASRDLGSLRLVMSGGAPIAPEVVRATVDRLGCDYVQTYGMTETSPYLTLSLLHPHLRALPREERLAFQARTGRPFRGVDLRVVDDAGRDVPPDDRTVGEIRVRGETVTPGYWNRPEETREAFDGPWLKTGDLAVVDAEGYVNIVDRKKDVILTGGETVYSIEVENVLYEHPDVLEAAVVGVPDAHWGEAIAAVLVVRPGRTTAADDVVAFCRERLAGFKVPRRVEIRDALPRTGSGKLAKRVLREELANR